MYYLTGEINSILLDFEQQHKSIFPDLSSIDSKYYRGKMNTTTNGRPCQRWDSVTPHEHTYTDQDHFPDGNISLSENYCRDPNLNGYLWCYTMDINVRWEKCMKISE